MARRVGNLQLGVYAAPSYLERAGVPLRPQELEGTHHRVVGFLSARTDKACLAACLGILWLPDYMAKAHLACGELVPLFEGWCLDPMPLYVAFAPNRHVSTKLRVFISGSPS